MYMQTTTWSHIQNPKLSFLQDKAETVVDTSWVMIHVSFEVSDTRDKTSLITFRFQTSKLLYKKRNPKNLKIPNKGHSSSFKKRMKKFVRRKLLLLHQRLRQDLSFFYSPVDENKHKSFC